MGETLSAYVVACSGDDFTCEVANLTARSLFLRTDRTLPFQERVSVTFFSVELEGEVALSSRDPAGLVVVFDAPAEVRRRLEAHMDRTTDAAKALPETKPLGVPPLEEPGLTDRTERPLPDDEETALELDPPIFDDDTGTHLRRGLTSHAAARAASTTRPPSAEATRRLRPAPDRRAQQTRLDNAVVKAPRRPRPDREEQITDLDPSVLLDDAANS